MPKPSLGLKPIFTYLTFLSKEIKGLKPLVLVAALINLAYKLIGVVLAFVSSYYVSQLLFQGSVRVNTLALVLIALVILSAIFAYFDVLISHDFAYKILARIRTRVYRKIDELYPGAIRDMHSADLVSIALADVELLESFYAHVFPQILVALLLPVVSSLILAYIYPPLVLISLIFLFILLIVVLKGMKASWERGAVLRAKFGELSSYLADAVQGIKDICCFAWESQFWSGATSKMQHYHKAQARYALRGARESRLHDLLSGVGILLLQVYAIYAVLTGEIAGVWLLPIFILSSAIFTPVKDILVVSASLGLVTGASQRIYELLQRCPSVEDRGSIDEIDHKQGVRVELKELSFSYSNPSFSDKPEAGALVLDKLSYIFEPGGIYAIVGASGSGKTTLVSLMQRFWDPKEGALFFNGVPAPEFSLEYLRDLVSLVPQSPYIFTDSVRNNLLIACPEATEDELYKALSCAQLDQRIKSLPEGLDTSLTEQGTSLSGGERQRLALARAFLKDSPILILDEACSSLDVYTEHAVHGYLLDYARTHTVIMVAHRLSGITLAQNILLLKDGHLYAQGSYQELSDTCPYFNDLLQISYMEGEQHGAVL